MFIFEFRVLVKLVLDIVCLGLLSFCLIKINNGVDFCKIFKIWVLFILKIFGFLIIKFIELIIIFLILLNFFLVFNL